MASCFICLDGPAPKNPLLLSTCGCKSGWFHLKCHEQWIRAQESIILRCGMCRQPFVLKTNYSFSPWAGPEQFQLWQTGALVALEFLYSFVCWSRSGNPISFCLPIESVFLLLLPFVCIPISTYPFYCSHIVWKTIGFSSFDLTMTQSSALQLKIILNSVHGLTFYLVHLVHCQREFDRVRNFDLFFPYAISREFTYVDSFTDLAAGAAR